MGELKSKSDTLDLQVTPKHASYEQTKQDDFSNDRLGISGFVDVGNNALMFIK